MARIEYLIHHPTEVEIKDLDLLNTEIEKYPYFYSLRALKLRVLKQMDHSLYEEFLPIASAFSTDRKELFQFIHSFSSTSFLQEEVQDEQKIELPQSDIQDELPSVEQFDASQIQPIEESINKSEQEVNDEELPTVKQVETIQVQPIEESVNESEQEESDKVLPAVEQVKTSQVQLIAESVIESEQEKVDKDVPVVEQVEDSSLEIPTLNEILVDIQKEEIDFKELVNFDIPTLQQGENKMETSIENSITIAEKFIQEESTITHAVQETIEINHLNEQIEVQKEIEQVGLIARSIEQHSMPQPEISKHVSNVSFFQIQNTKDEVKESPLFQKIQEEIVTDSIIEVATHVEELSVENVVEENILEEKPVEEEIISPLPQENGSTDLAQHSSNHSFSFNEWLKLSSNAVSSPLTEKEIKYQIIDEFLEKNPKITPIKKQEIPESKAEVKEIKTTDFSDLMTETLAQIYIEQKQYEKAIKAYKILSLKYPEKYSLFANQIKEIENLKNSK